MELELSKKETEEALMAWVETKWPGTFKQVEISDHYISKGAVFKSEPKEENDE